MEFWKQLQRWVFSYPLKRIAANERELAELRRRLDEMNLDGQLRAAAQRTLAETRQPNGTYLNERFRDYEWALHNIKTLGGEIARARADGLAGRPAAAGWPRSIGLLSKACTQADIESDWSAHWAREIGVPVVHHRKQWEFTYIAQALYEAGKLAPGLRGLGFGCGSEPLPSLFAKHGATIMVTDMEPEAAHARGWSETSQHSRSLEVVRRADICPDPAKLANIDLRYVDMTAIPDDLGGQFDFCWSACALEHLGSIEKGLAFIENSLRTLKPGGVAVHTTELNLSDGPETIDNWPTVLFQRKHFEALRDRLTAQGHAVTPFDFEIGSGFLDHFVDFPPWHPDLPKYEARLAHLRLSVDGFACTSFGLIVRVGSRPA